jgi:hypothetical protein
MPNGTASFSGKKMSYSDRLYYRTNAKQLQLYNNSSIFQQQQQCHMNHNHSQQQQQQPLSLPNEPMKQCWICDASVAEHSMHCKFCNKCVYGFDHHCICTFREKTYNKQTNEENKVIASGCLIPFCLAYFGFWFRRHFF